MTALPRPVPGLETRIVKVLEEKALKARFQKLMGTPVDKWNQDDFDFFETYSSTLEEAYQASKTVIRDHNLAAAVHIKRYEELAQKLATAEADSLVTLDKLAELQAALDVMKQLESETAKAAANAIPVDQADTKKPPPPPS